MRILVSSGELSGDQRLRELLLELAKRGPVQAVGCGPADVVENLVDSNDVSMMGIEALHKVWHVLVERRKVMVADAIKTRPDFAILVDYGGFNIPLGIKLRQMGIPVLYYVPPKLWAWGGWRKKRLKRAADILVPVFEFERRWLEDRGFSTIFYGHPAQDRFLNARSKRTARKELGISEGEKVLLLMPGSRPGEIQRHMPVLAEALASPRLQKKIDVVVVPVAQKSFQKNIEQALRAVNCRVVYRQEAGPVEYRAADVAWLASGTANLEAAWSGLPGLVFYKIGPVTYHIGRRVVQVPFLSPVNLICGSELYPEYLQEACIPEALVSWTCSDRPALQQKILDQKFVPEEALLPQIADEVMIWLKKLKA